jgi:multidrug efflux system outer membrane protein
VLDDLCRAGANRSNTSIQAAAARLAQARAFVRARDADRRTADRRGRERHAGAGASSAARSSGPPAIFSRAGADFSYEVDLVRPALACHSMPPRSTQARKACCKSARLLVQAQVAQTYLALRGARRRAVSVRSTVGAYRGNARAHRPALARRRRRRARRHARDHRGRRDGIERSRSTASAPLEHALAVLVGEVRVRASPAVAEWNSALPVIPAGLPSTLLTRRP